MSPIESRYFTAPDGLRLHALTAGPASAGRLPVICLPGLARTAEDFRELIAALALDAPRPRFVLALDSRGRGGSARDPKPENYSIPVELGDLVAVLRAAGIAHAVFVGTSRGGILTMALAAQTAPAGNGTAPGIVAGAVLNDIGAEIELAGLLRIKAYVGRLPQPDSWETAVRLLKAAMGGQFPALDDAAWALYARRTWQEGPHGLEPRYDPALSRTLDDVQPVTPPPPLWPLFDALAPAPLLVLRGEHSDLLSRPGLAAMRARRPDMETVEVPGQGHAPLLTTPATVAPVVRFVERCAWPPPGPSRPA